MSAAAQLKRVAGQRDVLRASFEAAWRLLPKQDEAALDAWAEAALELVRVNAGAACQLAFWSVSASGQAPLRLLASGGRSAAQICRDAGARAPCDGFRRCPPS